MKPAFLVALSNLLKGFILAELVIVPMAVSAQKIFNAANLWLKV
jgi:hypothetical protein